MPVGQPPPDNSSTSNQVSQTYNDWQIKQDNKTGTLKLSKEVHLNGRTFKVTLGYNIESLKKPESELEKSIKEIIDFMDSENIIENKIGPIMKDALPGERLLIKHDQSSQEGTTIKRSWSGSNNRTEEETFTFDTVKHKRFEKAKELTDIILRSNFIKITYSDQEQIKDNEKNVDILIPNPQAEVESPINMLNDLNTQNSIRADEDDFQDL